MRLSRKDTVGLVLATSTVGLLLVHGTERHAPRISTQLERVEVVSPGVSGEVDGVVAFVDVTLVAPGGREPRPGQVVIVQRGVVTEIGPVGQVPLPAGARVVDGRGDDFLLPTSPDVGGRAARLDPSRTIAQGSAADFVLLVADDGTGGVARPEGLMVRGAWYPREAVRGVAAGGARLTGGH